MNRQTIQRSQLSFHFQLLTLAMGLSSGCWSGQVDSSLDLANKNIQTNPVNFLVNQPIDFSDLKLETPYSQAPPQDSPDITIHNPMEQNENFCIGKLNGLWCDADDLVDCLNDIEIERTPCEHGCESMPYGIADRCYPPPKDMFCEGRLDGLWCDGDDLVDCLDDNVGTRTPCEHGCESMPYGTADRCYPPPKDMFCEGRLNGLWCDGDDLVDCLDDNVVTRTPCEHGCESMPYGTADRCYPSQEPFCQGRMDGLWCQGDDLVDCLDQQITSRTFCEHGCESMPSGIADRCRFCQELPNDESPTPPQDRCNYMDWNLSPDGFYMISRFGTSADSSTTGRTTTCGFLQGYYDYHQCVYDQHSDSCLSDDYDIPWAQGHVDYDYDQVIAAVDIHMDGDVPYPEYFYVAGAQRFGCGALLRVSNTQNGRCVVVYGEDGGPNALYEDADHAGRRILDASPAVVRYLQVTSWGWGNSTLMLVEWARPGDQPGQACSPCDSIPAAEGTEHLTSGFDPNHMQSLNCRS